MVQQDRFQYQMKNILEAKTLLVVRAAKRVHYQMGSVKNARHYLEALQYEFEADHIRFQKEESTIEIDAQSLERLKKDYLCFGNMLVRTISSNTISTSDIERFRRVLRDHSLKCGLIVAFSDEGVEVERVLALPPNSSQVS